MKEIIEKLKKWCKRHKNEIIVGVVCSLLVSLIFSFILWIKSAAPKAGIGIFNFLIQFFFYKAAIQTDTSIIITILTLVVGFFLAWIIRLLGPEFKSLKRIKNGIELLEDKKKPTTKEDKKSVTTAEKQESIKDIKKEYKMLKRLLYSGSVLLFIYVFWFVVYCMTPLLLRDAFEIDIIKITPYVESQEINQLKSEWTCMRSKEDFDAINDRVDSIKKNNDLPK